MHRPATHADNITWHAKHEIVEDKQQQEQQQKSECNTVLFPTTISSRIFLLSSFLLLFVCATCLCCRFIANPNRPFVAFIEVQRQRTLNNLK